LLTKDIEINGHDGGLASITREKIWERELLDEPKIAKKPKDV
jgi:hypothetical protein